MGPSRDHRWSALVRSSLIAAAVAVAFGVGAIAGNVGAHKPPPPTSVVDEAAQRIEANAVAPITRTDLDSAAVQAMLARTGDRWAAYYAPGDYNQLKALLDGRYSGLGVWLRRSANGEVLVASVLPESPAAKAGLSVGDHLVSVDAKATRGKDLGTVVAQLRGTAGSAVQLAVQRGGTTRNLTLHRSDVEVADVSVSYVADGVARIRVAAFTRGVGSSVRKAVKDLVKDKAKGIVLDLRGNPGGLLEEGVSVAGVFLDGGTVVTYSGKEGQPKVLTAPIGGNLSIPVAVLVDGGTASAAEVVTGALQDRGRAIVVGAQTFGKGSVQAPITLSDGSAIEITVARYLTPKGRSLDGKGIAPDIVLPGGADESQAVARAVDVLKGLVADASDATTAGPG